MIAHITTQAAWRYAQTQGAYRHASLDRDGYIHCSLPNAAQLLAVADAHFVGVHGLVRLLITPDALNVPVRFEPYEPGSPLFPHVYGPINLEAVTRVVSFPPEPDGSFRLPSGV